MWQWLVPVRPVERLHPDFPLSFKCVCTSWSLDYVCWLWSCWSHDADERFSRLRKIQEDSRQGKLVTLTGSLGSRKPWRVEEDHNPVQHKKKEYGVWCEASTSVEVEKPMVAGAMLNVLQMLCHGLVLHELVLICRHDILWWCWCNDAHPSQSCRVSQKDPPLTRWRAELVEETDLWCFSRFSWCADIWCADIWSH